MCVCVWVCVCECVCVCVLFHSMIPVYPVLFCKCSLLLWLAHFLHRLHARPTCTFTHHFVFCYETCAFLLFTTSLRLCCCCLLVAEHHGNMLVSLRDGSACWLLVAERHGNMLVSGTDVLGQLYCLLHWDRSNRSNILSHFVTVYWRWANQSLHWPCISRHLLGTAPHWSTSLYVIGVTQQGTAGDDPHVSRTHYWCLTAWPSRWLCLCYS